MLAGGSDELRYSRWDGWKAKDEASARPSGLYGHKRGELDRFHPIQTLVSKVQPKE